MTTFRELPGKLDADELLRVAFAWSMSGKEVDLLTQEYHDVSKAGLPTCTIQAGHGLAAHVKAAAAEAEAKRKAAAEAEAKRKLKK